MSHQNSYLISLHSAKCLMLSSDARQARHFVLGQLRSLLAVYSVRCRILSQVIISLPVAYLYFILHVSLIFMGIPGKRISHPFSAGGGFIFASCLISVTFLIDWSKRTFVSVSPICHSVFRGNVDLVGPAILSSYFDCFHNVTARIVCWDHWLAVPITYPCVLQMTIVNLHFLVYKIGPALLTLYPL